VVGYSLVKLHASRSRGHIVAVAVPSEFQRKGIATAMYEYIEKSLKIELEPSKAQSREGKALWRTRKWRQ
jgi:ribosomal protein S18 acetylase RimI-like enzyme